MKKTFLLFVLSFISIAATVAQDPNAQAIYEPCYPAIHYCADDMLLKEVVGTSLSAPAKAPGYTGGIEKLKEYFKAHPLTDKKSKDIVFRVHIAITVNCQGKYFQAKIISQGKDDLKKLSLQVLETVNNMPQNWQPAIANEEAVDCYQVLSFSILNGSLENVSYRK